MKIKSERSKLDINQAVAHTLNSRKEKIQDEALSKIKGNSEVISASFGSISLHPTRNSLQNSLKEGGILTMRDSYIQNGKSMFGGQSSHFIAESVRLQEQLQEADSENELSGLEPQEENKIGS